MATILYNGYEIDTDNILIDDMPTALFREIYELCGVETAVNLLYYMRGNIIQVPSTGLSKFEDRIISAEYDGTTASIRKIARKYSITEVTVRNILSRTRNNLPVEGQMDLGLFHKKDEE